jgi:DNA-binding SARP family transcriptional activator/tetratricopeptide (TPR) repeat protein
VAPKLEFCLLGPLVVHCDGATMAVPRGKQRALLAALLLNAGRVVPVDELTETLWGPSPPPSAGPTIRNHVKRLRHALGEAGRARIRTLPHGYLIQVGVGELDVARFEALQGTARQAAREGAWERAAAQLRTALELWRGEPLADVHSELLALREVPRLTEMRLQAVEARIDADLHLGGHGEVIAELRQLTAAHPLRERLHALLMLALYRNGQQGEALAAYQRARRTLIDELGAEPGPELHQLQHQILTADPALAAPAPASPAGTQDPAEAEPGADSGRGPGTGAVVPRQLPAPVAHFAGRAGELKVLTGLLDRPDEEPPGAVVISAIGGTAGVGKTALAVHWAHRVAGRFPDGQLYVNLRGFDPSGTPVTSADTVRRFLDALQVPASRIPSSPEAQQDLYRSLLADRRMLIVLDNASDAAQVRPLLPGGPACLVLVTSRSQLTSLIAAEGAHPVTLDVLSPAEAGELLERRLGPERIAAEPDAAVELTRLCARLPLALAIAAARAGMHPRLPLAALVSELREARGRLDALDAGEAATSVRAVLSWSYQELPAQAARMFRLLGVHPGPDITAPAAASLAGVHPDETRPALSQLTRANLLTEHVPGRFAFHDLLRVYAAERAAAEDSRANRHAATHRALDHYLHTAYAAALVLFPQRAPLTLAPPQPGVTLERIEGYEQAMNWFEAEHRVLLAEVARAASNGFDTHTWQLPLTMTTFLDRRGYWHDYAAVQHTALAAAERLGDRYGQAAAHNNLGYASIQFGSYEDARAHLEQSLTLYRQLGDHTGQGRALSGISFMYERQGRYREALEYGSEALALYRSADHRIWQAITLNNIGWYYALLGEYQQSLTFCEQALALHQELSERHGEAAAWDSAGYARHHLGQHAEAIACYQRALDLFREAGDRFYEAEILIHIGDAHDADGKPLLARDAWQRALTILDDLHHPRADEIRDRLDPHGPAGTT